MAPIPASLVVYLVLELVLVLEKSALTRNYWLFLNCRRVRATATLYACEWLRSELAEACWPVWTGRPTANCGPKP